MKEKIKTFLKNTGFLPLYKLRNFTLVHKNNLPSTGIKEKDLEYIKKKVSNKSGIYIYKKDKKIIYIGKASSLFGRIKNHYVSSYQEVKGDTKDKRFHRFFSFNSGKLKVYWKKQEDEKIRQIIEKMLDHTLNPTFNFFK